MLGKEELEDHCKNPGKLGVHERETINCITVLEPI